MSNLKENNPVDQELIETIAKNPQILEELLDRPELKTALSVMMRQEVRRSGPLPMASEVAKYNKVIPNGAERIMVMAEKEQETNHFSVFKQLEQRDKELEQGNKNINLVGRGQIFAFAIVCLFTALSAFIAYLGDTSTAGLLMGAGLVGIVTAFIYGKKKS